MAGPNTYRRAAGPRTAPLPGTIPRFLYENLEEKGFQRLCGALLKQAYREATIYPLGMSDGGRDITRPGPEGLIVYQVKWVKNVQRDPVAWLKSAIEGEADNIDRLVREGATHYVLMTNVPGTSVPGRGTMDKLDKELAPLIERFGIPMRCDWREDIDALVVGNESVQRHFSSMLTGDDAIRLLRTSEVDTNSLEHMLRLVMADQAREDSKVKFAQLDVGRVRLTDLFVDVRAQLVTKPRHLVDQYASFAQNREQGAASYLLTTDVPFTLVRGEPGQGKSTLGQYLCQVHRADLLGTDFDGPVNVYRKPNRARFPLRVDLRDYATWLDGASPFDDDRPVGRSPRPRPRRGKARSLMAFLADVCAFHASQAVSVETIHDLVRRFPLLVVLDGLDEVADLKTRSDVVDEIERLAVQGRAGGKVPQLVVTTRPSRAGAAEPGDDRFEIVELTSMSRQLQREFLDKWAAVYEIRGRERRKLHRIFDEQTAEDHVAQLSANPMQLTLLLYLIHQRGDAIPTARTPLYSQYMDVLLDREIDRQLIAKEHRSAVIETTSWIGWRMQSGVELDPKYARRSRAKVMTSMYEYLAQVERDARLVETLFSAVVDRFWALTSKVEGTFEFAVQPVREFFAARFLAEFAGMFGPSAVKADVLQELLQRSYWLNTARFFAGFAPTNELGNLSFALQELRRDERHPLLQRVAIVNLLSDGVFERYRPALRQAAALLADDLSVILLSQRSNALRLQSDRGGGLVAQDLMARIEASPRSDLNELRAKVLAQVGQTRGEFEAWWSARIADTTDPQERLAWLRTATGFPGVRIDGCQTDQLDTSSLESLTLGLQLGARPRPEGPVAKALLRVVLDGHATENVAPGTGEAADLLNAVRPQRFLRIAAAGPPAHTSLADALEQPTISTERAPASVFARLKAIDPRYERLQRNSAVRKGEKGSTAPWQNTARTIASIHGPCWLASEIALIGVMNAQVRTGGNMSHGEPFGPQIDYGDFVGQARLNVNRPRWWSEMFDAYDDRFSRQLWAASVLIAASEATLMTLLDQAEEALGQLDEHEYAAIASAASRLRDVRFRKPIAFAEAFRSASPRLALLLAHRVSEADRRERLDWFSTDTLELMCRLGSPAATRPAARAVSTMYAVDPCEENERVLRTLGPRAIVLDGHTVSMDPAMALAFVRDPSGLPVSWVAAAERAVTTANVEEPFLTAAVLRGWVPDSD